MNESREIKITRAMNGVAAGSADENGTAINMTGFETCTFIGMFGAITATGVQGMKVQESPDGSTGWADLAGTLVSLADTDDDKMAVVEIVKPLKPYLRPVMTRATANAVIDGVIAVQAQARKRATVHDATTVAAAEVHVSPVAGTA